MQFSNLPASPEVLALKILGYVRSCFSEKFGAPRQPGLIASARGYISLLPPYNNPQAVAELEQFSHIWVLFIFHQAQRSEWKPSVRPPRLGGNRRTGVFASRSPFRPNAIGMSPLRLERIEQLEQETRLHVRGLDLVDGTPVVDIKPYIPYVDAIPDAVGGYADTAPRRLLSVAFEPMVAKLLSDLEQDYPGLTDLIRETLAADPRPAYLNRLAATTTAPDENDQLHAVEADESGNREFGVRLYDLNIRWRVKGAVARVTSVERL